MHIALHCNTHSFTEAEIHSLIPRCITNNSTFKGTSGYCEWVSKWVDGWLAGWLADWLQFLLFFILNCDCLRNVIFFKHSLSFSLSFFIFSFVLVIGFQIFNRVYICHGNIGRPYGLLLLCYNKWNMIRIRYSIMPV